MICYDMIGYGMIYLLVAIGLTLGGSSTVHIYAQTVHRTTQNKQYIEQHKKCWKSAGRGIYLTTEEKARKNLSQGS
jgi:uncharacterized integral membrane protein